MDLRMQIVSAFGAVLSCVREAPQMCVGCDLAIAGAVGLRRPRAGENYLRHTGLLTCRFERGEKKYERIDE
jgi:hypothetical protein